MANHQDQKSIYRFSKKVLVLSLLFLAINLAWYLLIVFDRQPLNFRPVAPKLLVAESQEVSLQTPFDSDLFAATPNQLLLTGTTITTGSNSFAEIQLQNNVLRLDENTALTLTENAFETFDGEPRFEFTLQSGSVWVNAADPIVVRTDRAEARFDHAVGSYSYSDPLHRVISIRGNVDLDLLKPSGDLLSEFVVPLRNQVVFVDSQLLPEYERLEYSKLKKELKVAPIADVLLDDAWVKRNTQDDAVFLTDGQDPIYSASLYSLQNQLAGLRSKITFAPRQKRMKMLQLAQLHLNYLLGGVMRSGDTEEANKVLASWDTVASELKNDPIMLSMIERHFYAIVNASIDSPAYLLKENLRSKLFKASEPRFLRTYLDDLDFLMRTDQFDQAEELAMVWLEKWNEGMRMANALEFEQQGRIFHSIALAYSDVVTSEFLAILDTVGGHRLALSDDPDEALFEVALERLEVSRYLMASFRYPEAKSYLKNSYADLNLDKHETAAAAREIFLNEATLMAERIAYAEQNLRGAAVPVDEELFQQYLDARERDRDLEDRFISIVSESVVPEEVAAPPEIAEVVRRFDEARIIVLEDDVRRIPNVSVEFNILEGRLIERTSAGEPIIFSGTYDFSRNAIHDLLVNDMVFKGNFSLSDFIKAARKLGEETVIAELPDEDITGVVDFLDLSETDEADRAQLVAQDLAIQLMIRELEPYNLLINSHTQVTVLNPLQLTQFHARDVLVTDPVLERTLAVNFDYDSASGEISNVISSEFALDLPASVPASDFLQVLFDSVADTELREKASKETQTLFSKLDLVVAAENLAIEGDDVNLITFTDARLKSIPIDFSGVYDQAQDLFVSVTSEYGSAENVLIADYTKELAETFVLTYLASQDIEIGLENLLTELPADQVKITGYTRGDKLIDFTFDIVSNRLRSVQLEGVDVVVDSMTFEEFALIQPESLLPTVEEIEQEILDELQLDEELLGDQPASPEPESEQIRPPEAIDEDEVGGQNDDADQPSDEGGFPDFEPLPLP